MVNMRIGIGIDTGGTFTDCVLIDLESRKIVSKAKSPTTHEDLGLGITRSLGSAMGSVDIDINDIKAIALSTTLATNALIEGRGARIGLILIGIDLKQTLPADMVRHVRGGHTIAPDGSIIEIEPLDMTSVEAICHEFSGNVDAVAIVESFGTICPEHELKVKGAVSQITNLPVTCGHELTTELGFFERAVTAALNARLIPVLSSFVNAIESELNRKKIHAPVFLVKSDGTLTSSDIIKERPVETILTGPAASVIGAKFLTGLSDMIVIDQGGTTCLTSIVRNSWPSIDGKGATIASYKTRIKALRMRAIGLGGDSHIQILSDSISIGPRRLVPLCLASRTMPQIKEKISALKATHFYSVPEASQASSGPSPDINRRIRDVQPATVEEIVKRTGLASDSVEAILRELSNSRHVLEIGLAITDILHWTGKFVEYDREASEMAVRIMADMVGLSPQEFVDDVERTIIDRICEEIVLAYTEEAGLTAEQTEPLLDALLNDYSADLHLESFTDKPIVAVGACSYAFIPEVAKRMHTECVVPSDGDVCNAVGCIVGAIVERVVIQVRRSMSSGSLTTGNFQVLSPGVCNQYATKEEAMEQAKVLATELASKKAEASGAIDISVTVDLIEKRLPIRSDWTGGSTEALWAGSEVTATAIGRPSYWQ